MKVRYCYRLWSYVRGGMGRGQWKYWGWYECDEQDFEAFIEALFDYVVMENNLVSSPEIVKIINGRKMRIFDGSWRESYEAPKWVSNLR